MTARAVRRGRKKTSRTVRLPPDLAAALELGGEMGHLIRLFNWTDTPLGPIQDWPQSLRTLISACVQLPLPQAVAWGPELTYLYNDGMRRLLGSRHPEALGASKPAIYKTEWERVGPLHAAVVTQGVSVTNDQLRLLDRKGRMEEMHVRASLSPLRGESGKVAGVLTVAANVTREVVASRRVRTLQDLTRVPSRARTIEEACAMVTSTITGDDADIWFAMIYMALSDGSSAVLTGCSGVPAATPLSPLRIDLDSERAPWAIREVADTGLPQQVPAPVRQLRRLREWPAGGPPVTALTLPVPGLGAAWPGLYLVLGLSPVIPSDAEESFFELVSGRTGRTLAAVEEAEVASGTAALTGPDTQPGADRPPNRHTSSGRAGSDREAAARSAERQRIARDLHDSLTPTVYGIALGSERLMELASDEATRDVARYVHRLASTALGEIRALIFELRPEPLERGGLGMAVRELGAVVEARHALNVTVRVGDEPDCSDQTREAIYRIAQEALSNAVRHAHGKSVTIDVKADSDLVTLEVVDDGVGFDPDADRPAHMGQESMRERAAALGGTLNVISRPRGGTTVRAVIPREARTKVP